MKKILSLALVLVISFGMVTSSFASSDLEMDNEELVTEQKKIENVKEKLRDNGIEFTKVLINENSKVSVNETSKNVIHVDSIDEMKSIINQLKNDDTKPVKKEIEIEIQSSSKSRSGNDIYGVGTVRKMFYLSGGVFAWKTIYFNFGADWYPLAGYYTVDRSDINVQGSNVVGLQVIGWDHGAGVVTDVTNGIEVDFKVNGTYALSFFWEGFQINTPIPGEWEITLDDINDEI